MKKLKDRIARYSPRQLLTLKLTALVLGLILAFPPWLTCGRFPASWGGGCKWLPPYGWDFVLTVVSDEYKIINFVLLLLEVALVTAVGSYLMERFGTKPQTFPSHSGKSVFARIGRFLTIFFGLIAVILVALVLLPLFLE